MRMAALTSSPFVSPMSGFNTAPAFLPSRIKTLESVDEGVFVGAVQGISRLEGDDRVPALLGDESPHFARREDRVAEARVLGLRQGADFAADEMRFLGVPFEDHVGTGMIGPLGAVDALDVARLVPLEDVGDVERGHDLTIGGREGDLFAGRRGWPLSPW